MEEIREAAIAYYANFSDKQKKSAWKCFQKVDGNGDGKISLKEYAKFLEKRGFTSITGFNFFKALDRDGNGYLDFNEFITLYYICVSGRCVFCDGCGIFLKGLYFTCTHCFNRSSYDLCSTCYGNKNFVHHNDAIFYDNYTLLRMVDITKSKKDKLKAAFEGIKLGMEMGNIINTAANAGCNIM